MALPEWFDWGVYYTIDDNQIKHLRKVLSRDL